MRPVRVSALVAIGVGLLSFCAGSACRRTPPENSARPIGELLIGKAARTKGAVEIPVRPLVNLSGLSRAEVVAMRRESAFDPPGFVANDYAPGPVFSQIEDGRPWWGVKGLAFYGSGSSSADGLSAQSGNIRNPLVLIGLIEPDVLYLSPAATKGVVPYLLPRRLTWDARASSATAYYDMSAYLADVAKPGTDSRDLALVGYNASDLGLGYYWLDERESTNVLWQSPDHQVFNIEYQYLHRGMSCGLPGGCNNMSPGPRPETMISIQGLPAVARFKLWRVPPPSPGAEADMTFSIEMR